MATVELVLAMIAACIGFALIARCLAVPYAAVLVVGGMGLALIPGMPQVRLSPELALAFFLPPLLQGSAFRTDWRSFRENLRPILLLAVGLVLFTTLCVGVVARLLIPGLPWAAALALGAIVAPPDAVAASAVLQRLHLPRRVVTVLEGESLINDASSLILYRLAVAAVGMASISAGEAMLQFLLVGIGGALMGVVIGRLSLWTMSRIDDPILETALTFLVGYASYLGADALGVSGVISVVATGLVLGQGQHTAFGPRTRIVARTVWEFLEFVLNSLVFILIGLQLNEILGRLSGQGAWGLTGLALAVAATLIVSRFVWVLPGSWLLRRLIPWLNRHNPIPPWRYMAVISWAGMRGVVSLAAALALPMEFPHRDEIVFLAFTAILATLVLQGTTLEWLIRRLGVALPQPRDGIDPEEAEARRLAAQAALEEIERRLDDPLEGAIAADMVHEYRDRAGHLHRAATGEGPVAAERVARRRLRLDALEASRDRLLDIHRAGRLHDEGLARLVREVDLEELRIRQILGDERPESERHASARARRRHAAPLLLALPPHG